MHCRAVVAAEEQQEILRFEEVRGDNADDVVGGADDDSVSSEASFSAHLDSGSTRIFCTPSLRPKQNAVVKAMTFSAASKGRQLVVDRTGGEFNSLHDRNSRGWHHGRYYSITGTDCKLAIASSASRSGVWRRLRLSSQ